MIVNFVCLYLEDLIKNYKTEKIRYQNNFSQNFDLKKCKLSNCSIYWYHNEEKIDLNQYCHYILKLTKHPEINLIYSLILINRFIRKTYLQLNNNNIIKLILIGNLISSKILDDDFYYNNCWSSIGGVDILTLNKLEVEFLLCLEGNLNVSGPELIETYQHIIGYLKYHNLIDTKLQMSLNKDINSKYLFQEKIS